MREDQAAWTCGMPFQQGWCQHHHFFLLAPSFQAFAAEAMEAVEAGALKMLLFAPQPGLGVTASCQFLPGVGLLIRSEETKKS